MKAVLNFGATHFSSRFLLGILLPFWVLPFCRPQSAKIAFPSEGLAFFENKIRPLLAENCFKCHGDEKKKGNLQLNSRQAILKGGNSGPGIVPGAPNKSLLIEAVKYTNADLQMPPKRKLGKSAITDLEQWIHFGAPWPSETAKVANKRGQVFSITNEDRNYWAFRPIKRPPLPKSTRNQAPIDQLIQTKLNARGVVVNPIADKATLVRRAYFDLIGLPPTYKEVQAFVNDDSPDVWPRLIEHLLGLPQYGERWGRHWLDVVRFAQTNGYERDDEKPLVWKYRDYVIRAFNEDKPYDRFVMEQIAGDEFTDVDEDSLIATGFYRLGVWDDEPDDKRAAEMDGLDDMLKTTTETFMGLTLGCARCHDHMFDPISQQDYYEMLAFFRNVQHYDRPRYELDSPTYSPLVAPGLIHKWQNETVKRFKDKQAQLSEAMKETGSAISAAESYLPENEHFAWRRKVAEELKPLLGKWHSIGPFSAANYKVAFDTVYGPEMKIDLTATYNNGSLKWTLQDKWKVGENINLKGPKSATFVYRPIHATNETELLLKLGSDDGIKIWLNGELLLAHNLIRGVVKDQERVTLKLKPGRNDLLMKITNEGGGYGFVFEHETTLPDAGGQVLTADNETKLKQLVTAARVRLDGVSSIESKPPWHGREYAMTVRENGAQPMDTHLLIRGNSGRPGKLVEPEFLKVLAKAKPTIEKSPNPFTTGRRLALAKWIASPEHPLAARVMVNRIWQFHFGRGLVATPNDFGKAGMPCPNKPLIDWLAAEFIDGAWSIKHMHRVIMNSKAYRRTSWQNPANHAADPGNELVWRQNLRRLEAEAIRDAILKTSNSLNTAMGGRGFYPNFSGEVIAGASKPGRGWSYSKADEQARRSVYAFVKRTMMVPFLEVFDYSGTEGSIGARAVTTVSPQALTLLNSDFVSGQAKKLAGELSQIKTEDSAELVNALFRQTLARDATDDEIAFGQSYLKKQETRHNEVQHQLVFSPDVPAAMERGFRDKLPHDKFLIPPDTNWQAYSGKWGGGYEGIMNIVPGRGPFVLMTSTRHADTTINGRLKMDQSIENAGILLRANANGAENTGYEIHFDLRRNEVLIRRHDAKDVKILAKRELSPSFDWCNFRAELVKGEIRFWFGDSNEPLLTVNDESPIEGGGHIGIRAWGGAVRTDQLKLYQTKGKVFVDEITKTQSTDGQLIPRVKTDLAKHRALQDLCSVMFNISEFVYVD